MDIDLERCLSGDKLAWDAFVERWTGVIYAAVERARGGRAAADLDDCVQEVFVRLIRDDYRLLRTFDSRRASLSTWLTLVARSAALDALRRRRIETVPLEEAHHAAPTPRHPRHPRHPDHAHDPQLGSDLPTVPLHVLSPRQRLVLRMLFDEGMTVAEAARIIGVEDQTVRSMKHKALSRLREHLAEGRTAGDETTDLPVKYWERTR